MNDHLEKLKEISKKVSEAREMIKDGAFIDLSALHQTIANVCSDIKKHPPLENNSLEEQLLIIVSELNLLSDTVNLRRGKIYGEKTSSNLKPTQNK